MIARLRGRRPRDIVRRAWQLGLATGERWGLVDAGPVGRHQLSARLRNGTDSQAARGWLPFTEACARSSLAGLQNPGAAARAAATVPGHLARVRSDADAVRDGRFRLLGHDAVACGIPPDWHRDPLSGRRAPLVHWSLIPYLDAAAVGDHKVIWELNRHTALVRLAQAQLLVPDQGSYGVLARALLRGWLLANPPKLGINWCSSLEIAFRSIAWVWAARLLDVGATDGELWEEMLASLHVHGTHLERHLSTVFSPNTHLTGEALALLYLGTLLPCLDHAPRWRALGAGVLWSEATRHLRPDGTYFEQSTYYHRYTVDFYVHAALLVGINELPSPVHARLAAAVDALAALERPDGSSPLIGDDDGGRLLALDVRRLDDFRDTVETGAAVFGPSRIGEARSETAERHWLVPSQPAPSGPASATTLAFPAVRLFPDGGLVIVRSDGSARADWALLAGGPHGSVNGAHAHADALSLELGIGGRSYFVDSGTYTYTGPERDDFRGARGHSVALLDEGGSASPGSMFRWRSEADARFDCVVDDAGFALVSGTHDGFRDLGETVRYRRSLLWLGDGAWLLEDVVETDTPHRLTLNFVLAPCISTAIGDRDVTLRHEDGQDGLHLQAAIGVWHDEATWVSTGFASRSAARRLRLDGGTARRHHVLVSMVRHHGDRAAAQVVLGMEEQAGHLECRHRNGTVTVLRSPGGRASAPAIESSAAWVAFWRGPSGAPSRAVVVDGAAIVAGQSLVCPPGARAVLAEWDGHGQVTTRRPHGEH